MKSIGGIALAIAVLYLLSGLGACQTYVPLYRFYNPQIDDHYLNTVNTVPQGYIPDGPNGQNVPIGYIATSPSTGTLPLYRFYSKDHYFNTVNTVPQGYHPDGPNGQNVPIGYIAASPSTGTLPLYRFYNSNNHYLNIVPDVPKGYQIDGPLGINIPIGYIWINGPGNPALTPNVPNIKLTDWCYNLKQDGTIEFRVFFTNIGSAVYNGKLSCKLGVSIPGESFEMPYDFQLSNIKPGDQIPDIAVTKDVPFSETNVYNFEVVYHTGDNVVNDVYLIGSPIAGPHTKGSDIKAVVHQCSTTPSTNGMNDNTDRPGSDYKNFDLNSPDPSLCQQACAGDPNCKAFTFVKPGIQGPNARCWLKNTVPAPVSNTCCTSGVKNT